MRGVKGKTDNSDPPLQDSVNTRKRYFPVIVGVLTVLVLANGIHHLVIQRNSNQPVTNIGTTVQNQPPSTITSVLASPTPEVFYCPSGGRIISTESAVDVVRPLPEVKNWYEQIAAAPKPPFFVQALIEVDNPDDRSTRYWVVHVYERVQDGVGSNSFHSATMNWYSVDKCTGVIKCSFTNYDSSGKFINVSSESEYPC